MNELTQVEGYSAVKPAVLVAGNTNLGTISV